MATFSSAEYGKADFVLLDQLTEEAFMQNLKLRFQKGKIYTYIGKSATRKRFKSRRETVELFVYQCLPPVHSC